MCRVLSVREFVQETLIEEFGAIVNGKEKHDYLSFLFIACGIEFLGRCVLNKSWDDKEDIKSNFVKGVSLFPNAYQNVSETLYKGLRCGICHALLPQEGITVSSTAEQDLSGEHICLNIHTFYDDFKRACISLLENDTYKDKLAENFIAISENTTGSTQTTINLK